MESVIMRMFAEHPRNSAFARPSDEARQARRRIPWGPAIAALVLAATIAGAQERTPSPPGAEVYIISPKNGAKVSGPILVQFGLKVMGVAPAGVKFDNTGHHHVLIDTDPPADLSRPLPATEKIVHFGKGQTETKLSLPPGKHTLQLLFADQSHVPHDPPVISKKITITVQ
jgi:hypothetical protein